MSAARDPVPFARLALLQEMAAGEQRRVLGTACGETDLRRSEEAVLAAELAAAEANLDAVYGSDRLCPIRLRLAAAIVDAGEDELAAGRARLCEAEEAEDQARIDWLSARHRACWFADRARALRKQEQDRRDEAADREALALRLAAGSGSDRSHRVWEG